MKGFITIEIEGVQYESIFNAKGEITKITNKDGEYNLESFPPQYQTIFVERSFIKSKATELEMRLMALIDDCGNNAEVNAIPFDNSGIRKNQLAGLITNTQKKGFISWVTSGNKTKQIASITEKGYIALGRKQKKTELTEEQTELLFKHLNEIVRHDYHDGRPILESNVWFIHHDQMGCKKSDLEVVVRYSEENGFAEYYFDSENKWDSSMILLEAGLRMWETKYGEYDGEIREGEMN